MSLFIVLILIALGKAPSGVMNFYDGVVEALKNVIGNAIPPEIEQGLTWVLIFEP